MKHLIKLLWPLEPLLVIGACLGAILVRFLIEPLLWGDDPLPAWVYVIFILLSAFSVTAWARWREERR